MSSTDIDYVKNYFEFKTLTKIHGEPEYGSLKTMKDQLKTNAAAVTSDLAGGRHGHLGLVLTAAEMLSVTAIPYVKPVHPGPLVIPPGTTQHETNRLREDHKTAIRLFCECVDVKRTLI